MYANGAQIVFCGTNSQQGFAAPGRPINVKFQYVLAVHFPFNSI